MCRSIKTLRNAEPAASSEDVRAAALQYVRKVSGYRQPSMRNRDRLRGRRGRDRDELAAPAGRAGVTDGPLDPAQLAGHGDMDLEAFRRAAHEVADLMADYLATVERAARAAARGAG